MDIENIKLSAGNALNAEDIFPSQCVALEYPLSGLAYQVISGGPAFTKVTAVDGQDVTVQTLDGGPVHVPFITVSGSDESEIERRVEEICALAVKELPCQPTSTRVFRLGGRPYYAFVFMHELVE